MSVPNTSSSNSNSKIPSNFLSENIVQDDHAPLWAYVSIKEKGSEAGGNKSWSCNFCQKVFKSSYSRVKSHLLKIYGTGISVCSKVNDEYLAELKLVVELAENRVKPKHVPLPTEKTQENSSLKRRKSSPLERAFNLEDRDHLRALIARMFYSSGLPFNLARNPYYVNSYLFAANHNNISGFLPPGYNALRTTLLQQEKAHVETCDTDNPTLHLVYEMWDAMIEKMKTSIYRHKGKEPNDTSTFYEVVYSILIDRWTKSCTTLHCMAHSLNPRYYSEEWLREDPNRISPHEDGEISTERNKCLKKLFISVEDRRKIALEYADFSSKANNFASFDSIEDMWTLDPKSWWVMHGSSTPLLQKLALKLLVQPSSSSCCERNWSIYSFINSLKRNKLNPKRAEDLVYVHTNLRLLGRKSEEYKEGITKMWDISGDSWDNFDGVGTLEVASLSLDEPDIEAVLFTDDAEGGDEIDTIPFSRH